MQLILFYMVSNFMSNMNFKYKYQNKNHNFTNSPIICSQEIQEIQYMDPFVRIVSQ